MLWLPLAMFGKHQAQLFDTITPTAYRPSSAYCTLLYCLYCTHWVQFLSSSHKGFPWTNYGQVRILGISSYTSGFWEIRTLVQHALVATLWLRGNGHGVQSQVCEAPCIGCHLVVVEQHVIDTTLWFVWQQALGGCRAAYVRHKPCGL